MGIPTIFVLFLIFLFIFQHNLRKSDRLHKNASERFWEKEEASMFARKSPIETQHYIIPQVENLPKNTLEYFQNLENEQLYYIQEKCFDLASKPMLNFSNMLNSDIRLKYGSENLNLIEAYETNYNHYLQNLYQLGKGYYDLKLYNEAITVLEEGIRVNTDISDHIILLATLYCELKDFNKFNNLYDKSLSLTSLTKNKTIQGLDNLKKIHF